MTTAVPPRAGRPDLEIILHALGWGLGLSAFLTVAFIGLSLLDPEMWLHDYPPDIRAAFGDMSRTANRKRWLLGLPVMAVAVGVVIAATVDLFRVVDGNPGFGEVFLHTFVLLMVFNIVDLLIIDWLLFVRWQPDFVVLPGTEGLAGYGDYRFHWNAFLKGTAGILVGSLLVAGAALLAT